MKYPATNAEYEQLVESEATYFVASAFLGRGRYDRIEAETKAELIELLANRPGRWMIYAVAHPNHNRAAMPNQVMIERREVA